MTTTCPETLRLPCAYDKGQLQDLAPYSVIAFACAVGVTVFVLLDALVIGSVVRTGGYAGTTFDWTVVAWTMGRVVTASFALTGTAAAVIWLRHVWRNARLLGPADPTTRQRVSTATAWWLGCLVTALAAVGLGLGVENAAITGGTGASGAQTATALVAVATLAALVAWGRLLRTVTEAQRPR